MLVEVFCKNPKRPKAVELYTNQKFDMHDSVLSFIRDIVQPHQYIGLSPELKKIVTINVKSLVVLYKQYVLFERLGIPKLFKHVKNTLIREKYTIVKSKKALVIRGLILNVEKLKEIFRYSPNELSHLFDTEFNIT